MVELRLQTKMHICESPRLSTRNTIPAPLALCDAELSVASNPCWAVYEQYLRLPELKMLWDTREFANWPNESVLRPALQALEITFRFISTVLSDPRPYASHPEWRSRLVALAMHQVELISSLSEDDTHGTAPTVRLDLSDGVVPRNDPSVEVWMVSDASLAPLVPFVNMGSKTSLLPQLAMWHKSEDVALKIQYSIESSMKRCPYTLGLGEPNFDAKPSLDYDRLCKPATLYSVKTVPKNADNFENKFLYDTLQIFETWVYFSQQILDRIDSRIGLKEFGKASSDCCVLERTWRLLEEIEDLLILMDPEDLLCLKIQLSIKASSESEGFCFWSRGLVEMTRRTKELRDRVPDILGMKVDPKSGPRIQESMTEHDNMHFLQGIQGVEFALNKFYHSYKQLMVSVMGKVDAKPLGSMELEDSLAKIFL